MRVGQALSTASAFKYLLHTHLSLRSQNEKKNVKAIPYRSGQLKFRKRDIKREGFLLRLIRWHVSSTFFVLFMNIYS